jgi:hypothetical protein
MLYSIPHGERLEHGHPVILGAVPTAAAARFRQLAAVRGGGGSGHVMGSAAQAGQGVGQGGPGGWVLLLLDVVVGLVVRSQTILGTRRTGVVQYKQERRFALFALKKVHKKREDTREWR